MTRLRREYRVAGVSDAVAVVELCRQFQQESWQKFCDFDEHKMLGWVLDRIKDDGSDVFTAWSGKQLVGGLIGMTFCYPYSNTLVAGDYIWYVVPEHRGGMVGVRLMRMFENWARDVGAVNICTGATSGIKSKRGAALLEKLGYSPVGTSMQKDLV